jgi:predicted N-acyltransferase
VRIERISGIEQVDRAQWRALEPPDFPFFDHEFLAALERSKSVGRRTGWTPTFLVCWDGGRLLGALPLYAKTDSYGEYVFDWEWASAHERYGLRYYPKLLSAVPFTPATGPKLLLRRDLADADRPAVTGTLFDAAEILGDKLGASSTHALFVPEGELREFEERGFLTRHSLQFHWRDRGYGDFSDYLDALTSKRRRQISRERRQLAEEGGVTIERLTGEALTPEHAALMNRFYLSTSERKWGSPYLRKPFFEQVFRTMPERILFVLARDELSRRPVAGALFFHKGRALFGRQWGAVKAVRNLHFELCYYQGIEFAIERGMALFEAGAQGEHKHARGFLPAITYSTHEVRHPGMSRAIASYLAEERALYAHALDEYALHDPYKY